MNIKEKGIWNNNQGRRYMEETSRKRVQGINIKKEGSGISV